jgi:hypothetical protein
MRLFLLFFMFIAILIPFLSAAPITPSQHAAVMLIADAEGVPRSVANQLQIEEAGDWRTGAWGDAIAANNTEPGGWPSLGLYQIYMRPDNVGDLLSRYWYGRGETEAFDPLNYIHSAKLAMRYLASLHKQLGTWYRAACGYNAGASTVLSGAVAELPKYAMTREYAARIVGAREP